MNRLERKIYNMVRFSPRLKKMITNLYQFAGSLTSGEVITSNYPITSIEGYFFGFHDKCPWSADGTKILAHKCKNKYSRPPITEEIEVGFFPYPGLDDFVPVGRTRTWNWQMGAMLQWVGQTNNIIFNDYSNDRLQARVVDIEDNELMKVPRPVAAIDPQGMWGLSHSFIRLQRFAPAYAYFHGDEDTARDVCPANDGLCLIDLNSGNSELLFSIADIAAIPNNHFSDSIYHYLTHPLFSPNGDRFSFYHRWIDSKKRTWTRLFTCDRQGGNLHLFDTDGVVTHTAWKSDGELVAYALKKDIGDHYYLFKDKTEEFEIIGHTQYSSDGHPQFSPAENTMVTDSYPDRKRFQYLTNYNLDTGDLRNLAAIKSPFKFRGDIRCDLHPRWNRDGSAICFDSSHTGNRSLCILDLV